MNTKIAISLLALFLLFSMHSAFSKNDCENYEMSSQEIISNIRYLASDELRGRMSGTAGAEQAAKYISEKFKRAGLKPIGDDNSFFQEFSFVEDIVLGSNNMFHVTKDNTTESYELGRDYNTLSFSSSSDVDGELVFVGYGISAEELEYDDYDNLDVKNKVVMVLRYTPEGYDSKSPFYNYAALRYKALNAREKGAKAIIFVTPYSEEEEYDITAIGLDYSYSNSGIQSLILRREKAEKLLSSKGRNLKELEDKLSEKEYSSFLIPDTKVHIKTEVLEQKGLSSNVIGMIEGSDPVLKNQFIVIGAHYDHIGLGKRNSRSNSTGQIHNGADDNASGATGLIELAKFFACNKHSLKRSLVFIAFSAEELGLIGASHFIDNPKVPIRDITAMINMDMIGRLNDNKLTVFGIGSSPQWEEMINETNDKFDFELNLDNSGFAPSDQSVFFAEKIPVLQFFTGLHEDYHTPEDDWKKINSQGQKKVLEYIASLVVDLNLKDNRIAFSNFEEPKRGSTKFNVYLGTIPDYSNQIEGVKLMGVRQGSPAQKAGLLDNDTIVELNGVSIKNIYDYVYALSGSKPGVPTSLVVMRNYMPLSLIIVPEQRNPESNN